MHKWAIRARNDDGTARCESSPRRCCTATTCKSASATASRSESCWKRVRHSVALGRARAELGATRRVPEDETKPVREPRVAASRHGFQHGLFRVPARRLPNVRPTQRGALHRDTPRDAASPTHTNSPRALPNALPQRASRANAPARPNVSHTTSSEAHPSNAIESRVRSPRLQAKRRSPKVFHETDRRYTSPLQSSGVPCAQCRPQCPKPTTRVIEPTSPGRAKSPTSH